MVSDDQNDLNLENKRLKKQIREAENELDTARKRLEENNSTNNNLEREIDDIFVKFDEEQKNNDLQIYELKKQGAMAYHDFLQSCKNEEYSSDSDEPDGIEPFIKKEYSSECGTYCGCSRRGEEHSCEYSSELTACKPDFLAEVTDAYYQFFSHKSTKSMLEEETKKIRSEMEDYRKSTVS